MEGSIEAERGRTRQTQGKETKRVLDTAVQSTMDPRSMPLCGYDAARGSERQRDALSTTLRSPEVPGVSRRRPPHGRDT